MDTAEGSRTAVRERLECLYEAYGEFDVFGESIPVHPERYRIHRETLANEGVGRTRVWADGGARGLLLTRPQEGPNVWTIPETSARTDEPIADAATRCVRERADVECSVTDVYRVERVELHDRSDPDAVPLYDVTVHFDATVDDGVPSPGTGIEAADFHTVPPDSIDRLVASRLDEETILSTTGAAETG
jgi:ADP-ribose pyrophosphatase YjhB (NUDIX family)